MGIDKSLRIACVGAGYFSQFHRDGWARLDGADVVGVCDQDLAAAQSTGITAYSDLATMIETETPDVLDVILPPQAHVETIHTAMQAGVRTIICQKPFCRDLAEATALTQAANAADVTLIIHENFRFMPWYRTMRNILDEGGLGTVLQATFRLRPGDGQGPDAYMDRQPYFQTMPQLLIHETGIHWVDVFRFLFGDPTHVYADLRRVNPAIAGEDAGFVLLDHPEDVRVLLDGNRLLDHAADNHRRTMGEALIEGTKASLSLYGDGSVWQRPFGARSAVCVGPANTHENFGGDCVFEFQKHVIEGISGRGTLVNTAQDYLTVIRARDAIYLSAETGQKQAL
ncbi:MAG: Gfo/Idh/MocA family oxidoreductase [Rhodobacteraceae bacterium]|nr:Gfo/Idh/MocA family oxidoreductase [Paracoccaceae bacterium]